MDRALFSAVFLVCFLIIFCGSVSELLQGSVSELLQGFERNLREKLLQKHQKFYSW